MNGVSVIRVEARIPNHVTSLRLQGHRGGRRNAIVGVFSEKPLSLRDGEAGGERGTRHVPKPMQISKLEITTYLFGVQSQIH